MQNITAQAVTRAPRRAICGTLSVAAPLVGILIFVLPTSLVLALLLIPLLLVSGVLFAAFAWIRLERFRFLPAIGLLISLALILWVFSTPLYASPLEVFYRHSDPVAGWKGDFKYQPTEAIVRDYQEYLNKLPHNQKAYASVGDWLGDGSGRHAIVIEIALNGTWWRHVLIYDKNDKRIRTVKYIWGHYAC